ncbi:cyclic nucleotide-binding domain protein (macronuclear) [Tetrahymena thermophila SB210]|uniref:Cyclic nucleotide-binding domain protein n=1 Tax=Tetrahymena thermophila (strain SB210) TaxID=312017 RepID=Q24FF4_TETTS|nr:cyclic nucleotide-binding domain protein [Tetrahymena thermophila SB210]EAS06504.2 cyclic nucleotide-binding domain protein [Tetrahymena thermophila SB210]|eukprot:XP_001026749.2 cyclic nucleotide-binding domain protein [Tetrahymena thermophila SB210]
MQQVEVEQNNENFASVKQNLQEIVKMPTININGSQQAHNILINKQLDSLNFLDSKKDQQANKPSDYHEKNIQKSNEVISKVIQINENQNNINKLQPQQLTINTNLTQHITNQKQKIKISTQNLEKLSSKEKFDLAILALNQPANQRNPVEQKLIEDTIDSFAYIQKMKKRKPTLAKQVARVVEHQKCQKGQAVFFAGQQPEKFYMILRGKVAVLLKKSDTQIAMDRKNGKVINVQNIIDRKNAQISGFDFLLEKRDSLDIGSIQNTPKSPSKGNIPSQFSQQRQTQNTNENNSPLFKNNSFLFVNSNQNGLFGRKSSLQGVNNFSSQNLQKPKNMSIFNSQFFNEKNSNDLSLSTEVNQSPLDLISQIQKDNANNSSLEANTPTLKQNTQSKQNGRHRNTIALSKNNSVVKQESKQTEFVSKNIHLLPEELVDIEKFYDNGVFRYEFAKELEQGSAFGEMGLLLKVPRTATILSLEDTDFVCMSKQNYQQIIKSLENYKLEQKIQFFHQVLHFDLKIEEFGKLCIDFSQKKKFIKDQHIFKEGDKANEVLVIKSGEIELYKNIVGKDGKKKKIQLSYIGAGEIIGVEEIFFQNKERYYNARCLHEVKAYYINKYLFIRLMHEIPDLKNIMEKRAKNKVKWQEFKTQEIIEQHKIEGFIDHDVQLDIPQSDKQLFTLDLKELTKKNKKEQSPEDQKNTKENNQHQSQSECQSPLNFKSTNIDSINHKQRGSDLMLAHVRKLHEKNEELSQKTLVSLKHKVQEEALRGYDKIEDQIKTKEKILEMIEKNQHNLNVTSTQNQFQDKKRQSELDETHNQVGHLICNENWFDLDKKKQLEQKIADAIKVRRKPPGNTKIHFLKLKQKVNTLPSSQSAAQLTIETSMKSQTDLSSLPYDIRKKLVKFKKERDRSQFNEYINSLQDIPQDELPSPLSNSSSQLYSLSALRKVGKPNLSLSTNDKSTKQVFFAQSEASMGEISTPSPTIPKNGRFGAIHSSLNQLFSYPSQNQKNYQLLTCNKTNNSQSSFSDIKEEPILESQLSQKNITSGQKKFNVFPQSSNLKGLKMMQKQSTLQELDDEYEKDKEIQQGEQKSSLENFHNIQNSQEQEQNNHIQSYLVKPSSQSKIRSQNNTNKLNTQQSNQQTLISSIQYKSLNEIEQILAEDKKQNTHSRANKLSFQTDFSHQNQLTSQDHLSNAGLTLPKIRNSENLLSHLVSPSPKNRQYLQGGFKSTKIQKKTIDSKSSSFSTKFEKHPPEFIIKSHHIQSQGLKKIPQNQQKNQMNQTSTNQISSFSQVEKKSNNNNRSQSFQIKISHKV